MIDRPMKIGEFAAVAGVSIDAIRFYERRGVLRPAPAPRRLSNLCPAATSTGSGWPGQLQQLRTDDQRGRRHARDPRPETAQRAHRSGGDSSKSTPGSTLDDRTQAHPSAHPGRLGSLRCWPLPTRGHRHAGSRWTGCRWREDRHSTSSLTLCLASHALAEASGLSVGPGRASVGRPR